MIANAIQLPLERGAPVLDGITQVLDLWYRNYTTRRALAELIDHQLVDAGIDCRTAIQESRKPFWQR